MSASRDPAPQARRKPARSPRWLSQQRNLGPTTHALEAAPSQGLPDLQAHNWASWQPSSRCREWLERLDRGETVAVNLRSGTDPETEYVAFDRPRVLRVLARIIADLDELAGVPPLADAEKGQAEGAEARHIRHRQRLAEPEPPPKRLSMREERAALRALLDLPSSEKG